MTNSAHTPTANGDLAGVRKLDGMIRRRSLAALAAAVMTITVVGPPASAETEQPAATSAISLAPGALGANFNQNLDALDYRELDEAGATWVRGFFPMPAADQGAPAQHVTIRSITGAAGRGYKTILSLKFPYTGKSFPAPGSSEMKAELARINKVLPTLMGKVDILTIGNEPFIESLPAERDQRLNVFYETVAKRVIEFRRNRCGASCRTTLYMGALNRIDLAERRTPATARWMTFVRQTPEIRGVDIHPHVPGPEAAQAFLDYILPKMRGDQTFLVTEFSLTPLWRQHLTDAAPASFTTKYGFAQGTKVWQVIKAAIANPFPEAKWAEFLRACPWFANHSAFLRNMMSLYRGTGRLAVATYAFKQDEAMVQNWGPTKTPWLLNSVYAPYTVQPRGQLPGRSPWFADFRALQTS